MKKVALSTIIVLSLVIVTAFAFLYTGGFLGKKPFKYLDTGTIKSATVFASPPQTTVVINDKGILKELVEILHKVTIYQQDSSGTKYYGQLVRYTILLKTGETHEIGAFGSFIYVDDVCYKTKYGPSEELNALGNQLIKE